MNEKNFLVKHDNSIIHIPKFSIIMLIYNKIPDITSLLIGSKFAKSIVLIDNNSNPETSQALEKITEKIGDKCTLHRFNINVGISKAYNTVINNLNENDFDFIFLFDHDATFNENLFIETFKTLEKYRNSKFGIIVPIVSDRTILMNSNLGIKDKHSIIKSTITSGIFIPLKLFKLVKGFDENLFVEAADFEFTTKISNLGYNLIRINSVLIIQEFEEPVSKNGFLFDFIDKLIIIRSLIRIKLDNCNIYRTKLSFYNESRRNDLFRNLKYLSKKYKSEKNTMLVVMVLDYIENIFATVIRKIMIESK